MSNLRKRLASMNRKASSFKAGDIINVFSPFSDEQKVKIYKIKSYNEMTGKEIAEVDSITNYLNFIRENKYFDQKLVCVDFADMDEEFSNDYPFTDVVMLDDLEDWKKTYDAENK